MRNRLASEQEPRPTEWMSDRRASALRKAEMASKINCHVHFGLRWGLPPVEQWVVCKSATLPRGVLHIRALAATFCGVRVSEDHGYIDPAKCLDETDGRKWCAGCRQMFHRERRKAWRREGADRNDE